MRALGVLSRVFEMFSRVLEVFSSVLEDRESMLVASARYLGTLKLTPCFKRTPRARSWSSAKSGTESAKSGTAPAPSAAPYYRESRRLDEAISYLARPCLPLKRARRANVGTMRLKNGTVKNFRAGRRRDRMSVDPNSGRAECPGCEAEFSGPLSRMTGGASEHQTSQLSSVVKRIDSEPGGPRFESGRCLLFWSWHEPNNRSPGFPGRLKRPDKERGYQPVIGDRPTG